MQRVYLVHVITSTLLAGVLHLPIVSKFIHQTGELAVSLSPL